VRDWRIAIDVVSAAPEEQVTRPKRVELECILVATQNRVEISRFAHPDILLAGIARHVGKAVLPKEVINKSGAIHPAACWIGRAIRVTEILFC